MRVSIGERLTMTAVDTCGRGGLFVCRCGSGADVGEWDDSGSTSVANERPNACNEAAGGGVKRAKGQV